MKHFHIILRALCIITFVFPTLPSAAQYYPNYDVPAFNGSHKLPLAWVGGLNNPQFSAADLNNDDILDLVIFDRTGGKFLTFLNDNIPGTIRYTYAPKYELNFPDIEEWALLIDFNFDGTEDMFAQTNSGGQALKGYYNSHNELCFTLYKKLLRFPVTSGPPPNIPISSVDIPAFCDIDNDGDIDLLTFDQVGNFVNYFQNKSREKGYGADSLLYEMVEPCWGKFFEEVSVRTKKLNQVCPYRMGEMPKPTRHAGSTLMAFDNNGDGDKEVIIGDLGFDNLVYVTNGGDSVNAFMTWQDTLFPSYSHSVNLPSFPAAFNLDLNNDGLKDIVVSPNSQNGVENIGNVWYYRNIGLPDTGIFFFQTDSLFTRDMVEVGEGASPVFEKLSTDSLYDLVVANRNYYNAYSQLAYYKNIGTKATPQYSLVTRDYMNLSTYKLRAFYPAFGDLDGDGDREMILGNEAGTLLYFENTAGAGNPSVFNLVSSIYDSISVGGYSTPQLVDVNRDGLIDLLIGERAGNVNYFQNQGSASNPVFTKKPTNDFFGGVNVKDAFSITGSSTPFLTKLNGSNAYTLLVGCEIGSIHQYDNIDGNLSGTFSEITGHFSGIDAGNFSTISGADINNDGVPEIAVGNYRGGLTIYDTASIHAVSSAVIEHPSSKVYVYPNPSKGRFIMQVNGIERSDITAIRVVNIIGHAVHYSLQTIGHNKYVLDLSGSPAGMYFCQVIVKGKAFIVKLVIE